MQGIDLILKDKHLEKQFLVDEKAQLDYVNESLPTFAFELFYQKNGIQKQGWLFDASKKQSFMLWSPVFTRMKMVFLPLATSLL